MTRERILGAAAAGFVLLLLVVWNTHASLERRPVVVTQPDIDKANAKQRPPAAAAARPWPVDPDAPEAFYTFRSRDAHGDPFEFGQLRGKVVLIVNTATQDPIAAGHFHDLQELYSQFASRGLVILAFPSNQFGNMEPGSNTELLHHMQTEHGVTFTVMEKTDVDGEHQEPIFAFLKTQFPGMVRWNFAAKFLIDTHGGLGFSFRVIPAAQTGCLHRPRCRRSSNAKRTTHSQGAD
eukprot:m.59782 g.59782  ORF g.59782 m.59782 type:complete len:236 (+) comp7239_c0_seq2:177-884(+)